jgi:hypothetical protein
MTVTIATLGFPRIGPRRELKHALESFWSGKTGEAALLESAAGLRTAAWARQTALGADWLPSNDFSLYDHVLDLSVMLGAIPARYGAADGEATLGTYFAMARGTTGQAGGSHEGCAHSHSLTACEMTKWFDTNYHYIVPELTAGQKLALGRLKVVEEYREAKAQGYETRPVLLGPVTWLSLVKASGVDPFDYLDELLGLYGVILGHLAHAGAEWVQIDEPILVTDLSEQQRRAFTRAYARLARATPQIMLTTYFGGLGDNLTLAAALPVAGLHIDLVRAPEQLAPVLKARAEDARFVSRRDRRPQHLARRPRGAARPDRAARGRARPDPRAVLLAAPRPRGPRAGNQARRRGQAVARLRGTKGRGTGDPQARAQRGPRCRRRGAGGVITGRRQPPHLAAHPRHRRRRAHRRDHARHARAPLGPSGAHRRAGGGSGSPALPDHHDRLLPPDRGGPPRPRRV